MRTLDYRDGVASRFQIGGRGNGRIMPPWADRNLIRNNGPILLPDYRTAHYNLGRPAPIFSAVAEETSWGLLNPGGTLSIVPQVGSYDLAANYWAGDGRARARNLDGASDADTIEGIAGTPELNWQGGGIWFEILFKNLDRTTNYLWQCGKYNGSNNGYFISNASTDHKYRLSFRDGVVPSINIESTNTYNDTNYHLARAMLDDTGITFAVDGDTETKVLYSATGFDPSLSVNTNVFGVGSNSLGGQLLQGGIAAVNFYAGEPTIEQFDAYYLRLKSWGIVS